MTNHPFFEREPVTAGLDSRPVHHLRNRFTEIARSVAVDADVPIDVGKQCVLINGRIVALGNYDHLDIVIGGDAAHDVEGINRLLYRFLAKVQVGEDYIWLVRFDQLRKIVQVG